MGQIHGVAARVEWGYRLAAQLGTWTIDLAREAPEDPGTFRRRLLAALLEADVHILRQRPLTFVVPRQGRPALRWPIVTLEIGLLELRAELGPKVEDTEHVALRAAGK